MLLDRYNRARLRITGLFPNRGNLPYTLGYNTLTYSLLVDGLRERLAARPIIFVISSGRAGSGFLARLLDTSPSVTAEHEPRPKMTGPFLRMASDRPLNESYRQRQLKLLGINTRLLSLPSDRIYAETSHMFIKTFFDVVMDYYTNVRVIILRRDLAHVLKSFIELGYFSKLNNHWPLWMHDSRSLNCALSPIAPHEEMDQFDRCIAYLLDIEARARAFRENYARTPIHEVWLEDIVTPEGARALFESLDIEWSERSTQACLRVANARKQTKQSLQRHVTIEECRNRIAQYVRRARQASIPVIVPERQSMAER